MVGDIFTSLLQELGEAIDVKGLEPDKNYSCLICLKSGIEVQIEPYQKSDFMLLQATIAQISPGRYREDVFCEALKANAMPYPLHGIFAFLKIPNKLVLFELLPMEGLKGSKIADHLIPFSEKALLWKQAIERGELPSAAPTAAGGGRSGGLFGLMGR